MSALPSLFISHGAPLVAIDNSEARTFFQQFGASFPKPAAIAVVSAHFEHRGAVRVTGSPKPETIHDFGNFDPRLSAMQYPAPGHLELAERIVAMLEGASIDAEIDPARGLDHGAWVPLSLIYPDADVPVVELSVDPFASPVAQMRIGNALRSLRDEGVLIVGSGSLTHNLYEFFGKRVDSAVPDWVVAFSDWVASTVEAANADDLLNYERLAPYAKRNHPTPEHFLPFFAALGAGNSPLNAHRIHKSHAYGVLAMDAYAFQ